MRQRSDAFDDGGAEWFGRQSVAHAADHDVGAAGFHAGLPAGFKTARDSDQRDHRGNADRDAHDGEPGAHGPAHQSAGDDGEKGHVGAWLSASETMRPSFISMMRAAWREMPWSCVTRMSVVLLAAETHDQVEDQLRVFAVEVARRLVGEQDGRAIGETARDGDALAFSAGELGGKMMQTRFESDRFQQFDGPVFSFGDGAMRFKHRDLHVLEGGESWEQMEGLENETDLVGAIRGEIGALRERSAAILSVPALGWSSAPHLEQRGFSRAARAYDRDKLALLDAKIDAAQRLHLPVVVFLLQPAGFKHPTGTSIRDRHKPQPRWLSSWRFVRGTPRATGRLPAGRQD